MRTAASPDARLGVEMAVLMTASGARIEPMSPKVASAFFDRLGLTDYRPDDDDLAWGAFEDTGPLVGAGVLGTELPLRGRAWIAVAPERRQLGMGIELVALVAQAAQELGLRYLSCLHRTVDAVPDRLARSLGFPLARRVDGDVIWTVAVLPRIEQGEKR